GGDDDVVVPKGRLDADRHRLLADVEVAEPADLLQAVLLRRPLLEAPEQDQLAVHLDQRRLVELLREPVPRVRHLMTSRKGKTRGEIGGCTRFVKRNPVTRRVDGSAR